MEGYKKHTTGTKGHILGYINELEADKTSLPENAVTDCLNIDFYADHDRRRPPYSVLQSFKTALSGFTILDYHFKTFFDKNGNSKDCIIVAAKEVLDPNNPNKHRPLRIFIKGWYYNDNWRVYDNFFDRGVFGWQDDWVEITERYWAEAYYGTFTIGGIAQNGNITSITLSGTLTGYTSKPAIAIEPPPTPVGQGGIQATARFGLVAPYAISANIPQGMPEGFYIDSRAVTSNKLIVQYTGGNLVIHSAGSYNEMETGTPIRMTRYYVAGNSDSDFIGEGNDYETDEIIGTPLYVTITSYTLLSVVMTNQGAGYDPADAPAITVTPSGAILAPVISPLTQSSTFNGNVEFKLLGLTDLQKRDNYFKGWVFATNTAGVCGMVEWSIWDPQKQFVYMSVLFDYTPNLGQITGNPRVMRFPAVENNKDDWEKIETVNIIDNGASSVKFLFGDKCDMMWFGMIQDKAYFGKSYTTTNGYESGNFRADWIDDYQMLQSYIDSAANYQKMHLTLVVTWVDEGGSMQHWNLKINRKYDTGSGYGASTLVWEGNTQSQGGTAPKEYIAYAQVETGFILYMNFPTGTIDDYVGKTCVWSHTIQKTEQNKKWDGFYFSEDMPKVTDKKKYIYVSSTGSFRQEFKNSFGISITGTKSTGTADKPSRAYSLAVEVDGYQAIFLKNILCNDSKYISKLEVEAYPYFNRRLSAFLTFFDEFDAFKDVSTFDNAIPETYHVAGLPEGYKEMGKLTMTGTYKFNWFEDFYLSGTNKSYLTQGNDGNSLNFYLNEYYYSDHIHRAKGGVVLDNGIILYGIKKPEGDLTNKSSDITNNESIVVFSQYQNGGVDCTSIYSIERIRQLTRDTIKGVASLSSGGFMLFTGAKAHWFSYRDKTPALVSNEGNYETYGLMNAKGLVSAVAFDNAPIGTASREYGAKNFRGLYWTGVNGIYGFFGNQPESLTEGRWGKEYRALPQAQKEAITAGYNPDKEEIWFYIPALQKTYIWSILGKHWKKYQMADNPVRFKINSDGRITWNNTGNEILKIENDKSLTSEQSKDKNFYGIEFKLEKYLNHGLSTIWKVPDKYEILYEAISTTGDIEAPNDITVKVSVQDISGANINDDTLTSNTYKIHYLRKAGDINNFPITHKIKKRISTKWYKFSLENTSTHINVVMLKINGIINTALLTGGHITETK